MDSDSVIGIFLSVTALVILIPVLLQIRDGRFRLGEVWGMFVLVGGFAVVAVSFAFFEGDTHRWLSLTGLGAVLFGLLIQHKRRDRPDVS